METAPFVPSTAPSLSLGNFLSGMETGRARDRGLIPPDLGNFLSGMETSPAGGGAEEFPRLGNFLSGMETGRSPPYCRFALPLETSLVEWKLRKNAAEKAPWLTPWKLP